MGDAPERFRILPHTADGKFQAFGTTLEEAFSNAALATASLMWDWSKVEPRTRYSVRVRGRDLQQALVKFLGEIIFLFETRRFLLGEVASLTIERGEADSRIEAVFIGDRLADRYELFGAVKAVTYNEMKIEESDCGHYTVQVVVDM
jgi:SHS2 domain-containing protein